MTQLLPPELISAEERTARNARIAELRSEIPRQWARFAITEGIVIWVPFSVFAALYAAGVVSDSYLVPAVVVAGAATVLLMLYWVFARILPLSRELQKLEGG